MGLSASMGLESRGGLGDRMQGSTITTLIGYSLGSMPNDPFDEGLSRTLTTLPTSIAN